MTSAGIAKQLKEAQQRNKKLEQDKKEAQGRIKTLEQDHKKAEERNKKLEEDNATLRREKAEAVTAKEGLQKQLDDAKAVAADERAKRIAAEEEVSCLPIAPICWSDFFEDLHLMYNV